MTYFFGGTVATTVLVQRLECIWKGRRIKKQSSLKVSITFNGKPENRSATISKLYRRNVKYTLVYFHYLMSSW
jgi:hypothetical protein